MYDITMTLVTKEGLEILWEGTPELVPCGICLVGVPRRRHHLTLDGACSRGHRFHEPCIARWIFDGRDGGRCPLCRGPLGDAERYLRYSARLYDRFRYCEYVLSVADEMPEELLRFAVENCEAATGHPFEVVRFGPDFYRTWPRYDANAFGLTLWRAEALRDSPLMGDLERFVAARHTCGWECEEVPCFLTRRAGH